MRKWMALALCAALLAGCSSAPASDSLTSPESESTVQSESVAESEAAPAESEVPAQTDAAYTDAQAEQINVLNQLVDFSADEMGGSMKVARAAAALVEYLSFSDIEVDTMNSWLSGLTNEQLTNLNANWSAVLSEAESICGDPAGQADLLASAGVTTNFPGMVLSEVPDKLVTVSTVLGGKAGAAAPYTEETTTVSAGGYGMLGSLVEFEADEAGGSMKATQAAAKLVEDLSFSEVDTESVAKWMNNLTDDQREKLAINWPVVLSQAESICADPAGQADMLASAGVTINFTGMTLTEVPDKLVTLNTLLSGRAG